MTTVLVVDDEPLVRDVVTRYLERDGHRVVTAGDGDSARELIEREEPSLVLLDVMLPGETNGLDLCRWIRSSSELPVILLTARVEEADKVAGLDGGADDYITKPFSPRELIARVHAVLRRGGAADEAETVRFEQLTLDRAGHRVMVGEHPVTMGPTEYRLLEFFMTHPERVYSREQLLDRVWGGNVYVEERTIDVHIRRLRRALEDHGYDHWVQTVRGTGYRFSGRAVS